MIPLLVKLGLTTNEATVYDCLLGLGITTAGKIIKKTHLHRNIVYDNLEKLIKKGLVSFVIIKGIKVDKLEEKVETIIEAYFGCYSKLMGVEAEYPQGPVALNLELVSDGSGYLYPAIIPLSHGMSILRVFEGYEIKRVDDLNGKKILAYHCNRVLRAVCIPNDDFVIWVDRSIEYSEDALSEQLRGR